MCYLRVLICKGNTVKGSSSHDMSGGIMKKVYLVLVYPTHLLHAQELFFCILMAPFMSSVLQSSPISCTNYEHLEEHSGEEV